MNFEKVKKGIALGVGIVGATLNAQEGMAQANDLTHEEKIQQQRDFAILKASVIYSYETYNDTLENKMSLLNECLAISKNRENLALMNATLEFANKEKINLNDLNKLLDLLLNTGGFMFGSNGELAESFGEPQMEYVFITLCVDIIKSKIEKEQTYFITKDDFKKILKIGEGARQHLK